jgi:hypothetical protein
MLKNRSKHEQSYLLRPYSYLPSPVHPALLLDYSAGRIAGELWWTNQKFSPVCIIPPLFSMPIYHVGDEK